MFRFEGTAGKDDQVSRRYLCSAVATSALAMSPAPLHQPEGTVTQVREGCGPFRVESQWYLRGENQHPSDPPRELRNAYRWIVDRYWNAIVGNGGQESQCGWYKDKWGVSGKSRRAC